MSRMMKLFISTIAAMGIVRFALNMSGLPNEIVRYFSMTAIIIAGLIYFALTTATHKERLKAAYLLVMPYMIVEVLALGYTWASGRPTIFHANEYSLGFSIREHTIGHLVGGLTWEPLFVFLMMEGVWGIYAVSRLFVKVRAA